MPSLFSNPPAKTKSVTAPMVRKVPVSNIGSGSGSREIAKLPPTTKHTSQPPGIQQVHRRGRPRRIRDDVDTNMDRSKAMTQHPTVEELNANLSTLFKPMRRRNQQKHVAPIKEPQGPNEYFDEQGMATAVIHRVNGSTHNRHLNKAIVGRINDEPDTVPTVQEEIEAVNAATHFPKLSPLLDGHGTDVLIKY